MHHEGQPVAIFRRNRRAADAGDSASADPGLPESDPTEPDAAADGDIADGDIEDGDIEDETDPEVTRTHGPFDADEADDTERLDLGALRILGAPGMHLQLDLDETTQGVVSATVTVGSSAVQLQAFAAPRSAGIWPEIRQEIAASIVEAGGTAEIVDGPLGRELMGRMPGRAADGRTTFSPVRFLGVDGPRWFLRAVITGDAAINAGKGERVLDVVRSVVVVRGHEAMAPRELLPLRLPTDAVPPVDDAPQEAHPSADDLRPFERGPEITEVH